MSTTPMPGFHYIDFGESDDAAAGVASVEDDDCERIAQQFLYCSEAVREWPEFRRDAIRRKRLTPEICDGIERNVVAIFQEFVDVVTAAIESPQPNSCFGDSNFDHVVQIEEKRYSAVDFGKFGSSNVHAGLVPQSPPWLASVEANPGAVRVSSVGALEYDPIGAKGSDATGDSTNLQNVVVAQGDSVTLNAVVQPIMSQVTRFVPKIYGSDPG